jgi:hypothetical protein
LANKKSNGPAERASHRLGTGGPQSQAQADGLQEVESEELMVDSQRHFGGGGSGMKSPLDCLWAWQHITLTDPFMNDSMPAS